MSTQIDRGGTPILSARGLKKRYGNVTAIDGADFDLYNGEKVAYLGDTVDGDQAVVRTKINTRQGSEIPVEYRMHRTGDRWLAYDVAIEGVSLVANYRAQFNRIIQASSAQGLVQRLRAKQE